MSRRAERWRKQFHSKEFVEFVKGQPCERCGRHGSELHHEPPRSVGGTWRNIVPLCNDCHTARGDSRHRAGVKTFWGEKDYRTVTGRITELWFASGGSDLATPED